MAKTVEIPDELHEVLDSRAQKEGLSVSALVRRELEKQLIDEISPDELLERLRKIPPLDLGNLTSADIIREGREERTDQILDAISRR
jgi:post-segregation antitoxin (ccd killing protein)